MNAINNITIGHPERLRKPVGYTMLANLVNIFPFMLSIEAVNVLFKAYDGSGTGYYPPLVDMRAFSCIHDCNGSCRTGLIPP